MTGELYLKHHTPEYINYCVKSELAIMLRCQLCSTCYQPVWVFEKQLYNQSSQYEKYGKFSVTKKKPSCANTSSTLFAVKTER